mmetsp:Transcript_14974/g.47177  ORF Transcript_14974/g.47177 Transcript_14974/m.47177 type:complete len:210 (+) Transcript_14974:375-1004(+)
MLPPLTELGKRRLAPGLSGRQPPRPGRPCLPAPAGLPAGRGVPPHSLRPLCRRGGQRLSSGLGWRAAARPPAPLWPLPAAAPHAPSTGAIFTMRGDLASKPRRAGISAPMRIAVSFTFLRTLSSPSGQRWQCAQAWPFRQPLDFQNQAQGLHLPMECSAEPVEGSGVSSEEERSRGTGGEKGDCPPLMSKLGDSSASGDSGSSSGMACW